MDSSTQPKPSKRARVVRAFLIVVGLAVIGAVLFLGGRFLNGLGQRVAGDIAGVDETLTSLPTQTLTSIPQTATLTSTSQPSPTATDFVISTATTTPVPPWTQCPGIVVTLNDTAQGDILHVLRCEDGYEYDIGPLTKGAYAVSPDDRYLVYAGVNGILYASKIGDPVLYTIVDLKREGPFVVFPKKIVPRFRLKFIGDKAPYVLDVFEEKYPQHFPVQMPNWLSQ